MKNQKLAPHFSEANEEGEDATGEEGGPEASPFSGPDWGTKYPRVSKVLPAILRNAFAEFFSPHDEGGRPTCNPTFIVHTGEAATEPLNLMYSFCDEEGNESPMHEGLIKQFLTNLAQLQTEGVLIALNETHGVISFDSPETIRQFLHAMCERGSKVFDNSMGFRMRPPNTTPYEHDSTAPEAQQAASDDLNEHFGEAGQTFLEKDQLEFAVSLMPLRPYPSLRDALAAAAYVGARQRLGHITISLDGIDSMVVADYGQPLPMSYSIFH